MYTEDKAKAKEFLKQYGNSPLIQKVIAEIRNDYSHSDRWSLVFDVIFDNFPEYKSVTTGLVYLVEDGEI